AGYTAEIENVLDGARDKWFRPVDVAVAPDGSVFVSDWYDPGVGGHRQGDTDRGRLFRVTTESAEKYVVPKFDFDSIDGAIEALKNPCYSVRYLAWTALHARGVEAEPALKKLYENTSDPRIRARALWLLGKIEGRGDHYVNVAAQDKNADLRITSVRLARQVSENIVPLLLKLVGDDSPAVRRECAIALRHLDSPEAPVLWTALAKRYPAGDRWYLEALGIAADNKWDACLAAWLAEVGDDWNTLAGRDILWRSRAEVTPDYLVKIINGSEVAADELPRYLRAFDFLAGPSKEAALLTLAFAAEGDQDRVAIVSQEALSRLPKLDLKKNPDQAAALNQALEGLKGTPQFVELVARFDMQTRYSDLLRLAQEHSQQTLGVAAVKALLDKNQQELLAQSVAGDDHEAAMATLEALAAAADARAVDVLWPLVENKQADLERRRAAVRAAARSRDGAARLVGMAKQQQLDPALMAAAALPLSTSPYKELQADVTKLFPPPQAAAGASLPPLPELLKMKGNAAAGHEVYLKAGTCANCHKAGGEGKEVGPDLSEIGGKLSREALYESILFPSAGVSHNYETYAVILEDGTIHTGVLISQTDQEVKIKTAEAIELTFARGDIDELVKQPVSLMPANLQNQMTAQQLADLVEWM
ncbi:MAG: HEAT repeat domain-containing protein, partial [Pirellulales bacterium]